MNRRTLPRDEAFSIHLTELAGYDSGENPIGIIAESRLNAERDTISRSHAEYVSRFLGGIMPVRIAFRIMRDDFIADSNGLQIGFRHAYHWIHQRIEWMERNGRHLTKLGSWEWSEEFLSDLLNLRRIIRP